MIFSLPDQQPSPATLPCETPSHLPSESASLLLVLWERRNAYSVVWNEVEAVDVGGDFVGSGDDCARFLYLDAEAMVMEMALEPVVAMVAVCQETKVADFHDPVS